MASLMHGAAAGRAIAAKPIAAAFVAGCWWWASTGRGQMDRCWAHMDDPDFYIDAEIFCWSIHAVLSGWFLFEVFYHLTCFVASIENHPTKYHLSISPSTLQFHEGCRSWRWGAGDPMGFSPARWRNKSLKPWSWGANLSPSGLHQIRARIFKLFWRLCGDSRANIACHFCPNQTRKLMLKLVKQQIWRMILRWRGWWWCWCWWMWW